MRPSINIRTCDNVRHRGATRTRRPRKWASNAERVVELTAERDRLWQQVIRLQQHVARLENQLAGPAHLTRPNTID